MKALLATSFLFAAACGQTPCQKASDALKRFETKAAKCASGAKVRALNLTTCEQNIGNCQTPDLQKLETYWKCLDAVAACDPAKPADFKAAADACEQTADSFAQSCPAGLGS